jgi:hypothetical protein
MAVMLQSTKYANRPRGESVGTFKLKEKDVIAMRMLYKHGICSFYQLGNLYGVWNTTVEDAVKGVTWAHVKVEVNGGRKRMQGNGKK